MTIWFTSDTHFFHRNIMKFCPRTRRGNDADEMTELMIKSWNEVVEPGDVVYNLGDLAWGDSQQKVLNTLLRLNGEHHLILGNHDKMIERGKWKDVCHFFASVSPYKKITVENTTVVLFHYPMREWDGMHRGAYQLFGHVHGSLNSKPHGKSMDVGIDARSDDLMRPFAWDEIRATLADRPIIRHHGD